MIDWKAFADAGMTYADIQKLTGYSDWQLKTYARKQDLPSANRIARNSILAARKRSLFNAVDRKVKNVPR